MAPAPKAPATNLGQILEYVPDRLYLASYLIPPTPETYFPYSEPSAVTSPGKRGSKVAGGPASPVTGGRRLPPPVYFSIDDELPYNAFHHDFGPLHIGHLYRFAIIFHDVLSAPENEGRPIVFWSKADSRSRANAACILASYMVLIQGWPPHQALAPIAQVDPPLMPFRDAGYSQADYGITVQDVVYGVWKAKDHGCCDLDSFNLAEYEMYERVENGDFNWITPYFVAFASPSSQPVERVVDPVAFAAMPRTEQAIDACEGLNDAFRAVLKHFAQKKVGLVVRLNDQLYSPSYFEALGIRHLDMIFEDGTCPSLAIVRKFIKLANEMISVRKRGIAVHCKAGLGRTGCLIGAYLIYKHGFTANEVIAYMRFMRPGMVVGPQQHWLHINQDVFRQWRLEDKIERRLRKEMAAAMALPSTPVRAMQKTSLGRTASGQSVTTTPPPASSSQQMRSVSGRSPLSEMDNEQRTTGGVVSQDDYLPAPTPGQPRKTARHHPYSRSPSHTQASATANTGATSTSEDAAQQHQRHQQSAEVDEEWVMRMRARRRGSGSITSPDRGSQRSSGGGVSGRSSGSVDNLDSSSSTMTTVYEQTTTTTTTVTSNLDMVSAIIDNDASLDAENIGSSPVTRAKTAAIDHNQPTASPTGRSSAGSAGYGGIVVNKVRGSARATTSTRGVGTGAAAAGHHQSGAGVRKTSGRVGSIGSTTAAAVAVAAAVGREAKRVHAA